jgi:hypothetical protein
MEIPLRYFVAVADVEMFRSIGLDGGIREVAQQGLDAETAMAQLMTVMRVALAQRQQSFCEAEAGRPSMIEGRAIACF